MVGSRFSGRANHGSCRAARSAGVLTALVVVMGASVSSLNAQECEDISGVWAVELSLLGAPPQQVSLTLEQDGCTATGMVEGNNQTPFEDGTVEGSTVAFTTAVTNQADGSSLVLAWECTVDGDDLAGTLSAQMLGTVEFSGTRVTG